MNPQIIQMNMIKQQLRTGNVLDAKVLGLYSEIARDEFVPDQFKPFAYSDMQIELLHQQRMLTPLEEATLLQALDLSGTEIVLEVGTGTGFMTALLSRLTKQVISVDYYDNFTTHAAQQLKKYSCTNVELITGDAFDGWICRAPYDVMVLTGAMNSLNETHRLQISPGGKLFAMIGKNPVVHGQLHTLDHHGNWTMKTIFETNIPPLINMLKPNEFVF
jgi:protein-L-isoaspartate(D-aspartate) O-methyltransferase